MDLPLDAHQEFSIYYSNTIKMDFLNIQLNAI